MKKAQLLVTTLTGKDLDSHLRGRDQSLVLLSAFRQTSGFVFLGPKNFRAYVPLNQPEILQDEGIPNASIVISQAEEESLRSFCLSAGVSLS